MNKNQASNFRARLRLVVLILTTVSILISVSNSVAAPPPPEDKVFETIHLPPEALSLPADFAANARTSSNPKLDSAMAGLAAAVKVSAEEVLDLARSQSLRLSGDRVHVQIVTHARGVENAVEAITEAGGEVTGVGNDDTLIQGWLPIEALEAVAAQDDVYLIRRPAEVVLLENLYAGNSTTEGLAVINGPAWHAAGYEGNGVKVAVIDGGFTGYTSLLGTDLPASVIAKNFVDGETDLQVDGSSPHGTACAEIVHDIVPKATLYLVKISTNLDLTEAITWLITQNVDIISTSLGWYNLTPGDGTGEFADLVAIARSAGIMWLTAASNDREAHWGGLYADSDGDDVHEFNGKEINCFGPGGGSCYNINPGSQFAVYVRWNDWTTVNQDYNLYLLRWNGTIWQTIASSENVQSGGAGQRPTEFAVGTTSGSATAYGFAIVRYDSTQTVNFEIFVPKFVRPDEVLYARSLANLADAPDAMTVAALDVTSPYPQESYSSEGPTNGPGGAATGGSTKPDISGFANVATESYPGSTFNGTSAATPHVAGAAALVLSAYPSYTPAQLQSFLEGRAVDMGDTGKDTLYGYGRLYLGNPPTSNTAPTISDLPDQTVLINGSADNAIDLWNYASDAESADNELTFTIDNTPNPDAGVTIDSNRYVDINPSTGWTGQTDVTIRVADPGGLYDTDTFKVTVSNTAPVISNLPDQTVPTNGSADNAIDLWNYASDAESADNELTFTIDNTPNPSAGVTIDSNRYVDINPSTGWTGQTDVVIRVADPGGLYDTDTFNVTILDKVWTGSASTDWHTAGNWSPTGVPTSTDDVLIPDVANGNDPVISNSDAAVDSLIIAQGAVVDLTTRNLTVEGTLTNDGTLKQTQDVATGSTTEFLRITNLAGGQTKYYGVDITPSSVVNVTADSATTPDAPRIRLASGTFDPLAAPEPAGTPNGLRLSTYPGDGDGYYLVQFQGPIAASDVDALAAGGAEVFDYIPDFTFVVRMDKTTRAAVEQMKQIRWVGLYQPAYRLSVDLLARTSDDVSIPAPPHPTDGRRVASAKALWDDSPMELVVTIFRGEPVPPIAAQIKDMGGAILDQSQTEWKSKLKVSISPSRLVNLATLPGVRWIEAAPRWQLTNNVATDIMGVREVWDTHGLHGEGQTIGVCDSGLDRGLTTPINLHDDFEDGSGVSRVVAIHDLVGDGANDVNSGHGTHVAGSVLGNGAHSGATPSSHTYPDTAYAGTAPEASLVFQASEENATGDLSGLPADLNTLFAQAAGSGATLHTNSWGSSVMGQYTSSSEDVDEYTWNHKDFTILFSAGNEGIDSNEDGVIDRYSMGSPGTAKNCITVGATENNRPSILSTWGDSWPTDFPVDPINSDPMADDPTGMAAFSSRGPTLDGRFKPDLVAPGTFIASVKSQDPSFTGTGWLDINTYYMYMGGTSMATPLAAGAATIVSQYYSDTEGITPSAALIKATLANGATNIAPGQYGAGATQEISDTRPTYAAGWGRVNLEWSIFPTGTRVMTYVQTATGLTTGVTDTYTYEIANSAEPFRVTLAWSDYPGSPTADGGLVNDLDLKITGPGSTTYYPNNATQPGERLTYDDGGPDNFYTWSAGIRTAVRFTPNTYPATLEASLFYLASNSSTYPKAFNWYVYDGNDTTGPGTVLASGATKLTGVGWHIVDLSGTPVTITSGDFFLAIELPDNDLVWFTDTGTPLDQRSWDYDGSWSNWLLNDYMFNAIVKNDDPTVKQDRVNNLVGIDVESPATGVYTVTVSGYNIAQSSQPYALVASGAITSGTPAAPAPTVTSIMPNTGVNTGTVHITDLTGDNFQAGAAVKLTKSGQADITGAGVTVVSSTTITCTLDLTGAPVGAWNVVVTNPDDQSDQLAGGFTVNPAPTAPTVTSIMPNSGVNTGTVHITNLAGANFTTTGVTTVTLTRLSQTPITGDNVTVVSSSQITCDFDLTEATPGAWNVVVMNPDGQSNQLSNGFTVTAGAAITRVTVSISGNQTCADRPFGVKRCFDINPTGALDASVRFYFNEAERRGKTLASLLVFHYSGGSWVEEPGPYTHGGTGDAQYVEAQDVENFSLFAVDTRIETVYLPLVLRN